MGKLPVYDAFGIVPASVPPSQPVRHWLDAMVLTPLAFGVVYGCLTAATYHWPGTPAALQAQWWPHTLGGVQTTLHYLMGTYALDEPAARFWDAIRADHAGAAWRIGLPLLAASSLSWWVGAQMMRPRTNVRHLAGPRLLEGKEALHESKRRSLTPKQSLADPGSLYLHPDLCLPKKQWSRHALIYGSVGSGKTQILLPLIAQMIEKNHKLFLYDVKGDYSSFFGGSNGPIIVSPFDARSYVWDVAKDVRTATHAAAFAASLIPEEQGNGKFWTLAAQQILTGVIRSLQNEKGTDWCWTDLALGCAKGAEEMLPVLLKHYAKAAPLISNTESQATSSVLATLSGFTRVIDDLALAWPKRKKRSFSITDWIKDDYVGRKQVIVQAGGDAQLTKAYIAAMINVAVPSIISPALPDNEEGRFLGFVLDELSSIGRINIGPLIDKGRSKGVVLLAGMQDLAQIKQIYGDNEAKAMTSMVGMHIICQVQMGETRQQLAQMLGKKKVAVLPHGKDAVVREEGKDVLHADDLTDKLGFVRGKSFGPTHWGIRAIVQMGQDPLLLDFPGQQLPKVRDGQVAADWTTKPAGPMAGYVQPILPKPERNPSLEEKQETERVLRRGLTEEEIREMLR